MSMQSQPPAPHDNPQQQPPAPVAVNLEEIESTPHRATVVLATTLVIFLPVGMLITSVLHGSSLPVPEPTNGTIPGPLLIVPLVMVIAILAAFAAAGLIQIVIAMAKKQTRFALTATVLLLISWGSVHLWANVAFG